MSPPASFRVLVNKLNKRERASQKAPAPATIQRKLTIQDLNGLIKEYASTGFPYVASIAELAVRVLELQTEIQGNRAQCCRIIDCVAARAQLLISIQKDPNAEDIQRPLLRFGELLTQLYPALIEFTQTKTRSRHLKDYWKSLRKFDEDGSSLTISEHILFDRITTSLSHRQAGMPMHQDTRFVGQTQLLASLEEQFPPRLVPASRRIAVVCGAPGTGTTELGLQFYHLHRRRFSVKYHVDASSRETLTRDFHAIGRNLGHFPVLVSSTVRWLEQQGGDWFLFFDNSNELSDIEPFIPSCNHGNVLIAGRNPQLCTLAPDSSFKILDFTTDEAVSLLLHSATLPSRDDQAKDAAALVQVLDHHPLAIAQAAAALRSSPQTTLPNYLSLYTSRKADLISNESVNRPDADYPRSVYATLDLIFDNLTVLAAQFVHLCASWHRERISKTIFRNAFRIAFSTDSLPLSANDATAFLASFKDENGEWQDETFQGIIDELVQLSLIIVHDDDTYSLPSLVHKWSKIRNTQSSSHLLSGHILGFCIRHDYSSQSPALRQSLEHYVLSWMSTHPNVFDVHLADPFSTVLIDGMWNSETLELLQRIVQSLKQDLGDDDETTLQVQDRLALLCRQMHRYDKAKEIWASIVESRKKTLGDRHQLTLKAMSQLVLSLFDHGEFWQAESLGFEILDLQKALIGDDNLDVVHTKHAIALALAKQRRLREAEQLQLENLDYVTRIYGVGRIETITTMSSLASIYYSQGRAAETEELDNQMLDIRRRFYGDEHPWTLLSMQALAVTYRNRGRYAQAEKQCDDALAVARDNAKIGLSHPSVLKIQHSLSLTYYNQSRFQDSAALQRQIVETQSQTLGPAHMDTLETMHKLVSSYRSRRVLDQAEPLAVKVLELHRQVFGQDHRLTHRAAASLARVYYRQSKYAESEELFLKVLDSQRRLMGDKHWNTLRSIHDLASLYSCQGRYDEAEEKELEILAIERDLLGPDHEDTLSTMFSLAHIYRKAGRSSEAEGLTLDVLERRRRTLGSDHPDYLSTLFELGYLVSGLGRFDEAEKFYTPVLAKRKEIMGPEHPDVLQTMGNLACVYRDQSRYDMAETFEVEVLEKRRRISGPAHKDTLRTASNLVRTYKALGKLTEATALTVELVAVLGEKLGSDHPSTVKALTTLGELYHEQGRYRDAEEVQIEIVDQRRRKYGNDHSKTLTAKQNLSQTYFDQGRSGDTERLQWEILTSRMLAKGQTHKDSLRDMLKLATTYTAQGRLDEAMDLQAIANAMRNA